jgi:hypothetical protein
MRALAHYLDERADHAAEQAVESSHHGRHNEKKLVDAVSHFAQQARAFHDRMDRYADVPWEVPDEVDHLNDDARKVNDRIRRAHVFEHTWDDWDAVLDVLDRMNRLLAGQDVQVPAAHRPGFRDYDDDYGPGRDDHTVNAQPDGGDDLGHAARRSGSFDMEEFRRLAHELDEQPTRARDVAMSSGDDSVRTEIFLKDIDHFNRQTHQLHQRSDADRVEPREVAPTVNQLLADARRTDQSIRAAGVFRGAWEVWSRTIRVLDRMADLVAGN